MEETNTPTNPPPREYLGDGVYATFDGYHIVLTTGHHEQKLATNIIALEPTVIEQLKRYEQTLNRWKLSQNA